MRQLEVAAWAKAFEVDVMDLPAVLGLEVARVDGVRHELTSLYRELGEVPDGDLRAGLWRSLSALGAAQNRLMHVASDVRRSA